MFSVDDLLLAHGYQLPRRSPVEQPVSTSSASSSCSDRSLEAGCRRSSGRDAVNVSQRDRDRDRDRAPEPALLPLPSQQTRLNSGLPLPCPAGLHSGKDINYWRRRGQDFSALLDYTNHGGSEGSNAAGTGNIPKAEQRGRGWQEHRLKSTQRRAGAVRPDQQAGCTAEGKSMAEGALRGDMWGPPMDRKCQSLGTEEWRSSLGRQSSDSGGAKLRPNILPRMVSDEGFHKEGMEYVRKGKSQSLPRVTPDINGKGPRTGLHYVTTSGIDTDIRLENQCLSDRLVLQTSSSYCDPKTSSKWPGNVRQSSQFAQLSKAKFSRPLNPPSYELYQQIRRSSEMIPGLHVRGDNEGQGTDVARDNDHNSCPNLDNPPVYVPPSACPTQPQRHVGRKCLVKVPSCHHDAGRCSHSARTGVDQPHWCCPQTGKNDQADPRQVLDENGAKRPLLQATNATDETGNGAHPSRGSHNGHSDGHRAFVKYIPFTDPRIRHMTIVQSEKRVEEADCERDPGGNGPFPAPPGSGGAFSAPPGSRCSGPAGDPTAPGHGRSLAASPEKEKQARSGHGPQPPAGHGCGVQAATRVRTWAPGSRCFHGHGTQQQRQPRRRVAETIFCLVSVPLQAPEEEEEDEEEEEEGASEDHSLSSCDLELQALTGDTTPADGPKGPRRWGCGVGSQGGVASSFKRHRELGVSGSWPGDQRRDRQTQTSFGRGPRAAQLFASALRKGGPTRQQSRSGSEARKRGGGRGWGAAAAGDHPVNGHPPGGSVSTGAPHTQRQVGTAHRSQPEGAPRLPREKGGDARGGKDRGCPHAPSDPGVGAAGFGQFLLKPVARRPRDAISELENFNKEIQDREDPNTQTQRGEGEASASREIRPDAAFPGTQTPLPRNPEPERPLPNMTAPGEILEEDNTLTPGVQKAHSVSAHHNRLRGQLSDPLCRPGSQGTAHARRSAILNIFSSKSAQFTRLNREQSAEDPDSKTQCAKTNGLGAPMCQLSEREGGEAMDNNTLVREKAAGNKKLPAPETRSNGIIRKMFFQFDTDQMSLEPDPSSFTSWESTKPTIDEASGLLKRGPVRGISKTESFEERAARILGIDVAVDALISPVGMEQRRDAGEFEGKHPWVEELRHTCDPATTNSECASGEVLGGGVGQGVGNSNRLERGDSPVLGIWVPNGNSALQNESPGDLVENGKGWQSRKGPLLISEVFHEPFSRFYDWADRNCHFGTASKNTPLPGQDRKGRSASGRIEALQGRLAAAPRHAAPGRLARMKEVDSVSRIRRLSTKSTDPADGAQCSPEQGDREGPCTPARMEDTRASETRVPSRGEDSQSAVPSIAVSTGSKEAGDAYDPSKVETV